MRTGKQINQPKEDNELHVAIFSKDTIDLIWNEIEPMLEECIEISNGMQTMNLLKMLIDEERAVIFATLRNGKIESVTAVREVEYATFKSARIIACAGKNLAGAMKFIDVVEAWATSQGCVELEGWCRPSMTRFIKRLGWDVKLSMVTRDLRRKLQ